MKATKKQTDGYAHEPPTVQQLTTMLSVHKVRPSQQRLMILEYLLIHHNHPSVDMIYNELLIKVPTLSRATVYNTLNLFLKAGLVKVLDIVENEARYDIFTDFHGHFKCSTCGDIFNFRVSDEALVSEELKGFVVDDKNVYFKGICPKCLKKSKGV